MRIRFDEILERIITINQAWKLSRDEFGNDFAATKSFRDTKSSLQATLLREFPEYVYLKVATDSDDHGEAMYSVRLKNSIRINDALRTDAEHLPIRIAEELFTPQELQNLLNQ
ncbi:conserved hypothetical protein [Vibrio nigripulchritudo SO65]|uniref:hypothetical protein n=1 Tax=Vibrio nigripulchritudo TaxID=28173 RepID=UPI0003B19598|nr:hypothetical protein [Vibrio nigripulchritudo]CCN34620.1 conserved hypothetical protein [Vibrio nigripulchritudo AM115]CCN40568.1 conserved hypothetical protein [Vibrio nigripulchritudo FTn2]CCN66138.1 conserved hypothetical protein [Vibrio nigripulchritudo POn4]CCN78628.1 conserved hypothetical protein [Vibrio nigripulchritudo SO65]